MVWYNRADGGGGARGGSVHQAQYARHLRRRQQRVCQPRTHAVDSAVDSLAGEARRAVHAAAGAGAQPRLVPRGALQAPQPLHHAPRHCLRRPAARGAHGGAAAGGLVDGAAHHAAAALQHGVDGKLLPPVLARRLKRQLRARGDRGLGAAHVRHPREHVEAQARSDEPIERRQDDLVDVIVPRWPQRGAQCNLARVEAAVHQSVFGRAPAEDVAHAPAARWLGVLVLPHRLQRYHRRRHHTRVHVPPKLDLAAEHQLL